MAREFILFVHICHWIGWKTAVPFKMSSGLLTVCHRNKMKTSGEWGQPQSPGRLHKSILPFLLFSQTTNFPPLWIPHFKKNPQIWTHAFYGSWALLWGFVQGEQEKGRPTWATTKPPACQLPWASQRQWKHDFYCLHQSLPNRSIITALERILAMDIGTWTPALLLSQPM